MVVVILMGAVASSFVLLQWMNGNVLNTFPTSDENLQITKSEMWYGYGLPPYPQAAVLIANDKDVAATIQRITFRGVDCDWNDIYYSKAEIGSVSTLNPVEQDPTGNPVEIAVDGKERSFQQANGKITLEPYKEILLYIRNAGNFSSGDMPSGKITIAVFTERNVYLGETSMTSIAGAIGFMSTEEIRIINVQFTKDHIIIDASNTGSSSVTMNEVFVNAEKQTFTAQTIEAGAIASIDLAHTWRTGDNYQIKLVSSKGSSFMYTAVAVSS